MTTWSAATRTVCACAVILAASGGPCAGQDSLTGKAHEAGQRGDYAGAETYYRQALKTSPRSPELWNGLGIALNRQNRFSEAAQAFRTALAFAPSVKGLQLNLGIALFRAGQLADAAGQLESIQDQPQARELLALAYVGLERYAGAIPILEELAVSSADPSVHIALASCYAALHREADLERTLKHMFQAVPDSAPLHMALGQAYDREFDPSRAIAEYRKAAAMDPKLPGAHLQAGRLLWRDRRFDEAEPEFIAELKVNPGAIEAKYYLGTIYLYRNDPGRAVPLLEEFVNFRGSQKNGYVELGRALLKQEQFERAAAALEKAESLGPDDANVRYLLAQAYKSAGRAAAARREFEESKRIRTEQLQRANKDFEDISPEK